MVLVRKSKGVPQGSVLGPLLFNIYVAGLPSIAEQHNASLPSFADDMSLYCSRKTEEEACRDASQALDAISLSLQEIGLTMNTDKTTTMVVNARRRTPSMASQTAGGSIYCQGRQVAIDNLQNYCLGSSRGKSRLLRWLSRWLHSHLHWEND